jgi:hypothetical protein
MTELAPDVATLLRAHGLEGARQEPLLSGGYTGAALVRVVGEHESFVLKRVASMEQDWVRRVTADTQFREVAFALSPYAQRLPAGVAVASVGAAIDGDGRALLMRDLTAELVPEHTLDAALLDAILRGIATMHAAFWDMPLDGVPVADPVARITLISPQRAITLQRDGVDFGFVDGWRAFERRAPKPARDVAHRLFDDMQPLERTLRAFPQTLVHGDLKVANMAYGDGALTLLDWTMVMRTAVSVDIAWFLAVNSSLLPDPLDDVLERYAGHLERALGAGRFAAAAWPAQRHAIMLMGLLMYGWGKAPDAEAGRPEELRWWCEGAVEAARALDL